MPTIKNIIWDLDGTLFDTYPSISAAFQAALRDLGAELHSDEIMPLARVSFNFCAEQLSRQTGLDVESILDRFFEHYASIPPGLSPPFRGAREVCQWAVNRGGKNLIVTHRKRSSTEALLDKHNLRGLFAGWVTHDDGFARKPSPDSFTAAFARFEIDPAETLAIGDRDLDLQAAQSAGVAKSYAFGPGPFNVKADWRVFEFGELLRLLECLDS